jgi:hypothetical protein
MTIFNSRFSLCSSPFARGYGGQAFSSVVKINAFTGTALFPKFRFISALSVLSGKNITFIITAV